MGELCITGTEEQRIYPEFSKMKVIGTVRMTSTARLTLKCLGEEEQ